MRTFFTAGDSPEGSSGLDLHILHAEAGVVHLPSREIMLQGMYSRAGSDLVITTPEDGKFVVKGFFLTDPPPSLTDGSETHISGEITAQFAGPIAPMQYAGQAAAAGLVVGQVRSVSGTVMVTHADGSTVILKVGDLVYQDDVVETAAGANCGLVFVDGTTLALSENGEMLLDEMVYNPATKGGKATLQLISGAAAFVSGTIAKSGQDNMTFKMPVGTIGIRGTKVFLQLDPATGDVTILNRPTGVDAQGNITAGEIFLTLPNGQVIGSMTAGNGGWQWNPTQGGAPVAVQLSEAQVNAIAAGVENSVNQMQQDLQANPPPVQTGAIPGTPGAPGTTVAADGTTTPTPQAGDGTVTTTTTAADGTTTTATTGTITAPTPVQTTFNVGPVQVVNNTPATDTGTAVQPTTTPPPPAVVPPPPPPVILPAEFSITGGGTVTDQSAGVVEFTIVRAGNTTVAGSVSYTAGGGSATSGTDYGAVSGSVDFLPGETSKTIIVPILANGRSEGEENFTVTLSGNSAGTIITGGAAAVVISADPPLPTLSINSVTVSDTSPGTATLTVTRSGAVYAPSTVSFSSGNGSANAGSDYSGVTGTISFAANQTTASISIPILANTTPLKFSNQEGVETFTVTLTGATDATITNGVGTVTIAADPVVGQATFSVSDGGGGEGGSASVTITRGGDTQGEVSVDYSTADGSAGGSDYSGGGGTLVFAAGEVSKTISFGIANDGNSPVEGAETFTVSLSNPDGGTIASGTGTVTISADTPPVVVVVPEPDPDPATITINDVSVSDASPGTATFTVTRSGDTSGAVDVTYTTVQGSATAGTDFGTQSGTIHFAPGVIHVSVAIDIFDDSTGESAESFSVLLTGVTGNATIADTSGVATIAADAKLIVQDTKFLNRGFLRVEAAPHQAVIDIQSGGAFYNNQNTNLGSIDLVANSTSDYGRLAIHGDAHLTGVLVLSGSGYTAPTVGDSYTPLSWTGDRLDMFDDINGIVSSSGLKAWLPEFGAYDLTLTAVNVTHTEADLVGSDLTGTSGNDVMIGSDNPDNLMGDSGNDLLIGGLGNDVFYGDAGNDVLVGGLGGIDTADFSNESSSITIENGLSSGGSSGNDVLIGIEKIIGTNYNDSIITGWRDDGIDGGAGNDYLNGAAGHDTIYGGDGNDIIYGSAGADALWGDDFADTFSGNDTIYGGDGQDTIRGGQGNDTIIGGESGDELYGGAGIDQFVYLTTDYSEGNDYIQDFQVGTDKIVLNSDTFDFTMIDASNFAVMSGSPFNGSNLSVANTAWDSGHATLIYDPTGNGTLFYDADGNASNSYTVIVTSMNNVVLGSSDIQLSSYGTV